MKTFYSVHTQILITLIKDAWLNHHQIYSSFWISSYEDNLLFS